MERTRHAYAILGLLTLLSLGSAANSAGHAKAGLPALNVVVVNPTGSPVPTVAKGTTTVAGTVAVSSLPAVQVSSLPAVQVQADLSNPVPVQDAAEANRTWMTFGGNSNFSSVDGEAGVDLFRVPAGKQFVMEYTNAQFTISGGLKPTRVGINAFTSTNSLAPGFDMPAQVVGTLQNGEAQGVAEAHGPVIFQPGTLLSGFAGLNGTGGGGFVVFTVTGFLQDAPPAS